MNLQCVFTKFWGIFTPNRPEPSLITPTKTDQQLVGNNCDLLNVVGYQVVKGCFEGGPTQPRFSSISLIGWNLMATNFTFVQHDST